MRKTALLVLVLGLVFSLFSLGLAAPTKAQDGTTTTPCAQSTSDSGAVSTSDGSAVGTPDSSAADTVSYVGTLSEDASGNLILTTVDGDVIVVAPSGAFAPGQLDMSLTYEITGTETEDGTLKAQSIAVVDTTATPEATPEATAVATASSTAAATSTSGDDGCTGASTSGKVTICHLPGGDINKARTLSIGASALPAHLAHGDSVGACAKEGKPGKPSNTGKPGGNGNTGKPGGNGNGKPGGGKGKP